MLNLGGAALEYCHTPRAKKHRITLSWGCRDTTKLTSPYRSSGRNTSELSPVIPPGREWCKDRGKVAAAVSHQPQYHCFVLFVNCLPSMPSIPPHHGHHYDVTRSAPPVRSQIPLFHCTVSRCLTTALPPRFQIAAMPCSASKASQRQARWTPPPRNR